MCPHVGDAGGGVAELSCRVEYLLMFAVVPEVYGVVVCRMFGVLCKNLFKN